ncbi:MAG: hypothetical protein ACI87E_003388, partial [Mariniblastus sp.]
MIRQEVEMCRDEIWKQIWNSKLDFAKNYSVVASAAPLCVGATSVVSWWSDSSRTL